MKKRMKRRSFPLIRPVDALLPLAFLVEDVFGQSAMRGWLFAGWFAVRLFSLFTADSVRMAFATQPGMRQVRRSTTTALLMQIVGAGALAGLWALVFHGITPFILSVIGIGLALNIEHVFYEYLAADGDRYSANLCGILTAALVTAGIMLDKPGIPLITLSMSGAACLITLLIAVILSGYRPAGLNFAPVIHGPRATIYGVLYPAAVAGALYAVISIAGAKGEALTEACGKWAEYGLYGGFYAGLALLRVTATPFRRSRFESRTMAPVMICTAILAMAVCACCFLIERIPANIAGCAAAAALCIGCAAVIALILWGGMEKSE